ncbi:hypothetical protein PAXINDRAFT_157330, partial [Paxillus involutus ATCC 200175]
MDSEESFARLVNTANPAVSHSNNPYLQPSYPPSHTYPQTNLMDPFFDDEEDLLDSTPPAADPVFAIHSRPAPMQSQDSSLPLTRSAAPPAGLGPSSASLATTTTGQPQGWNFDDDAAFQGSASFPGLLPVTSPKTPNTRKRKWKWPWKKELVLTGERVIALNNPPMNDDFCDNFVSTSKYNALTFPPKFLKGVSPTNQYTTIAPLAAVLLASAFKEVQEDLKRHQSDSELNARAAEVLSPSSRFERRKWKDLRVGDIVRVESDDFIPADL